MVAINEILLSECTGEECGGDNDICTDSRVHHRNAENRAPVTRNHRSAPILGRWLTRDPIGYQGGINLYGYVDSSPVGNADAEGLQVYTWRASRAFDPNAVGIVLAPPVLHLHYQYSFRYYDVGGQPGVGSLFASSFSPTALGGSVSALNFTGGYHLELGTETFPDPKEHALLLVVQGVYRYYWTGQVSVGLKGVSIPGPAGSTAPTTVLTFEDDFLIFDDCGKVRVAPVQLPWIG